MNSFYHSQKVYCTKILTRTIKKIKYKTGYKNNQIYHYTKLYFESDKHPYHVFTKLITKYTIGDMLTIVYFKHVNCNKRYIKSIRK